MDTNDNTKYNVIFNEGCESEVVVSCIQQHVMYTVAGMYAKHYRDITPHAMLTTLLMMPDDIIELAKIRDAAWEGEDVEMTFYGEFTINVRKQMS